MIKYSRIAGLMLVDLLIVNFSYIFALLLRFEFEVNSNQFNQYFTVYADNIVPLTAAALIAFAMVGIYTSIWRYAGSDELVKIGIGSILASVFGLAFISIARPMTILPRSVYIISAMMMFVLVACTRYAYRFIRNLRHPGTFNTIFLNVGKKELIGSNMTKVMIVGAGDAGASIIKEIKQHPEYNKKVAVAIDDDSRKIGKRISGVKIAADRSKIKTMARKKGIDEIIVAIPSANHKEIQNILNECNKTKCKIKVLPSLGELINGDVSVSHLRDVEIEDLLGRDPVKVNLREISGYLEEKIVLVTGGGGSIGSELCRQIARFRPRRIIAMDIYENTVFELANEMKSKYPQLEFEVVIGSVRSRERVHEVFEKYKPHVVFHAAAHKHVPLMEKNPKEAIKNNIIGTKNLIDMADEYSVSKFVLISTDKAVNPTNVMGATKRAGEMMLQEKSTHSRTSYTAVRFGNVLGSNGSVIPIFRKQIENGGPVTVTHPDITRYFMTIPEAVQLVIQAGAMADGGEIFVLDMGEPVRIMDLAENIIRLSGYIPRVDIDIEITGLRPGEKLYEELLLDEENMKKTAHQKIYVERPLPIDPELNRLLSGEDGITLEERIEEVVKGSDSEAKEWLHTLVKSYTPQN
ncbi:MAG: nucleoside-diphosphate sugar epimerase [Eubacteriales Family XIII. Incertae Sedis bacterium]|nr:MAG: nucleoside-diphosphate sugar epimerase [Clostridiales Family XIII bacterium]